MNSAVTLRWAANSASELGRICPPGPRVTGSRGSWGGLLGKYDLEFDLEWLEDLEGWRPRPWLELVEPDGDGLIRFDVHCGNIGGNTGGNALNGVVTPWLAGLATTWMAGFGNSGVAANDGKKPLVGGTSSGDETGAPEPLAVVAAAGQPLLVELSILF
jgi:hypothetical protein